MSNLRLCTGRLAEKPFYLNTVCMNVYSLEEICYLFAMNPFIINSELMNAELVEWIDTECGVTELADSLRAMLKKGCQAGDFAHAVLDYVSFCNEGEIAMIDETLKNSAGLNEFERKKQQADYLLKNGRPEAAIDEYESLLAMLPDVERNIKPKVYQNIGYAYACLFMFDVAAKYYKRSYDMTKDVEVAMQFLSSLRMSMSENKYISFISDHKEFHEASLKLEKKMTLVLGDFEGSRESIMLNALNFYKDEGNVASYYEEIDGVIADMKEDYLSKVHN